VKGKAEMTGRHWYVKKDYAWLWPIVWSLVGFAILSVVLFFAGSRGK